MIIGNNKRSFPYKICDCGEKYHPTSGNQKRCPKCSGGRSLNHRLEAAEAAIKQTKKAITHIRQLLEVMVANQNLVAEGFCTEQQATASNQHYINEYVHGLSNTITPSCDTCFIRRSMCPHDCGDGGCVKIYTPI